MDKEHRAREAKRLLNEPLLAEALESMLMTALVDLSNTAHDNMSENIRLRAVIDCLRTLPISLKSFIAESGEMDGGISDEATE